MEIILGERLKELRCEKGYTKKQLAEKIGINMTTYRNYEKDIREPSIRVLVDFALFYGVSVDYLLGLNDYG